jgi:hypothetical protein
MEAWFPVISHTPVVMSRNIIEVTPHHIGVTCDIQHHCARIVGRKPALLDTIFHRYGDLFVKPYFGEVMNCFVYFLKKKE